MCLQRRELIWSTFF